MGVLFMFLIFSKEKICAYLLSILTVITLFGIASMTIKEETVETSTQAQRLLPIYDVEIEENKVAFTMNCAWSADDIDSILETLEKENIKITFFLVGDWIDANPEVVKKIYEAGHEIGTHSDTHPHVNNLTYEKNVEEIEKCNDKIENITGKRTNLYRTPYGEYNNTVLQAAYDKGYYCIQWNLDTLDYEGLTGEQMWERIKDKLKNGSIILSHNGTDYTADSLEMLIKNIKQSGFEIVKVSDIIYKDSYIINNNGTQIAK